MLLLHKLTHLLWASTVSNGGAPTGLSTISVCRLYGVSRSGAVGPGTTVFPQEPQGQIPKAHLFTLVLL